MWQSESYSCFLSIPTSARVKVNFRTPSLPVALILNYADGALLSVEGIVVVVAGNQLKQDAQLGIESVGHIGKDSND